MPVNSKSFNSILSLHKQGVSSRNCINSILQLTYGQEDHRSASDWIEKFYQETEGIHLTNESKAINSLVKCGYDIDTARNIVKVHI